MTAISQGESAYRMYLAIIDRRGTDEAEKWRKTLPLPYKRMLKSFMDNYVNEDGSVKDKWQSEESIGG